MIITNCPKCGSMNITTAGVCANCGWSQFAQVTTVSTRITGEIEIMLSGKALLDDYKRLLFENNSLTARIAELEGLVDKLIEVGDALESQAYVAWRKYGMLDFPAAETWCALVKDWKEREENG